MCALGEPVASVLAGQRLLQKFQKRGIEKMRNRKFDKNIFRRDFFSRERESAFKSTMRRQS